MTAEIKPLVRPSGLTPDLMQRWTKFSEALWELIEHPELGDIPCALVCFELDKARQALLNSEMNVAHLQEDDGE